MEAGAWSMQEAAEPYRGQEIKVICEGYPACFAMRDMSVEFTEKTGIKVAFEIGDMLNISQRVMTDMLTKSAFFDLAQIHHTQLALFAEQAWTTPLSQFLDDPRLKDPSLNMGNFIEENMDFCCKYNGELLAAPWYYIPLFPVLRQDLIAHPEERAAFKAKYGYELPAPELVTHMESWQQWMDMAEFFTRKEGDNLAGKVLDRNVYGIGMPFQRHLAAASVFWTFLTANGGQIIDADGKATIGEGTAAVDALKYMLEMTKYAPPGWAEYNWDNQYTDFCNGTIFSTPSLGRYGLLFGRGGRLCVRGQDFLHTPSRGQQDIPVNRYLDRPFDRTKPGGGIPVHAMVHFRRNPNHCSSKGLDSKHQKRSSLGLVRKPKPAREHGDPQVSGG